MSGRCWGVALRWRRAGLVAAVASTALLVVSANASAQVRIVSDDPDVADRARRLAERSLLPTPPIEVAVVVSDDVGEACGIPWAMACARWEKIVVERLPPGRELSSPIFFHELGHIAQSHLNENAFEAFADHLFFRPDRWHERNLTPETWAEAWARCSTRRRYPESWADEAPYFDGYAFYPTRPQLRATCRGFATAAQADGWAPATNPAAW